MLWNAKDSYSLDIKIVCPRIYGFYKTCQAYEMEEMGDPIHLIFYCFSTPSVYKHKCVETDIIENRIPVFTLSPIVWLVGAKLITQVFLVFIRMIWKQNSRHVHNCNHCKKALEKVKINYAQSVQAKDENKRLQSLCFGESPTSSLI